MTTGEVHVGDVGTHYKARIQDAGVAFDPTAATTTTLLFRTPTELLTRDAVVTPEGGDWYLNYTLVEGADDAFHASAGRYRWQGYVEFADGSRYHTNIETYVVVGNLS